MECLWWCPRLAGLENAGPFVGGGVSLLSSSSSVVEWEGGLAPNLKPCPRGVSGGLSPPRLDPRTCTLEPAEGIAETGASVSDWSPSSDITVDGSEPGLGKNTERLRECIRECRRLCWAALEPSPFGMPLRAWGEVGTEIAPMGPLSGLE